MTNATTETDWRAVKKTTERQGVTRWPKPLPRAKGVQSPVGALLSECGVHVAKSVSFGNPVLFTLPIDASLGVGMVGDVKQLLLICALVGCGESKEEVAPETE